MDLNDVHKLNITTFPYPNNFHLQTFTGDSQFKEGARYTDTLVLRHAEDHFTRLGFEVSKLDDQCDAILPHWWLCEHQPAGFYDKDPTKITFDSPTCKDRCTSLKVLGKVGRIASVTNDIDSIPERFRELSPLVPTDISKRLPQHKAWNHSIDL